MYSVIEYGNMIADRTRFSAYRRALMLAVRTDDVVAEIGCGPGILSMIACMAGARKVYAIETADVIYTAKQIAAANGLAERIEFFHANSRHTRLPERVNVIVSDLRGALPLFDHAISIADDARRRFLTDGGILIPQRDLLKAAIIEAEEHYLRIIAPWTATVPDINLSIPLDLALNNGLFHCFFAQNQLLSDSHTWFTLDYQHGANPRASGEMVLRALRNGTAHGICVWFDAHLFQEASYSTGPGCSKQGISGQLFLPWPRAVQVAEGQDIRITLHADLVGGEYIWRWESCLRANGYGQEYHFRQSTLQGCNLSPEALKRKSADFVPELSEQGCADRWLVNAMDGQNSLERLAKLAAHQFPKIFARWEDAMSRAAELAAQFSR